MHREGGAKDFRHIPKEGRGKKIPKRVKKFGFSIFIEVVGYKGSPRIYVQEGVVIFPQSGSKKSSPLKKGRKNSGPPTKS